MIESRTGLVHIALGHSQEDFLTSMKYKLPVLSPIGDNGNFIKGIGSRVQSYYFRI